jgi:hypothetical protein
MQLTQQPSSPDTPLPRVRRIRTRDMDMRADMFIMAVEDITAVMAAAVVVVTVVEVEGGVRVGDA